MKYLLLPDEATAAARSAEEAEARGCDMVNTMSWWPWRVDPETGAAGLLIEDGDALRPGETASDTPPGWLSQG